MSVLFIIWEQVYISYCLTQEQILCSVQDDVVYLKGKLHPSQSINDLLSTSAG